MKVSVQNTPESITIVMNGELDTLTAEQIDPQIQEVEAMVSKPLIIDCTELDYISSSGLRMLLRLRKAAKAANQQVTLLSVNANIMEVLKVTHFDKMFAIK